MHALNCVSVRECYANTCLYQCNETVMWYSDAAQSLSVDMRYSHVALLFNTVMEYSHVSYTCDKVVL